MGRAVLGRMRRRLSRGARQAVVCATGVVGRMVATDNGMASAQGFNIYTRGRAREETDHLEAPMCISARLHKTSHTTKETKYLLRQARHALVVLPGRVAVFSRMALASGYRLRRLGCGACRASIS